MKPIIGITVDAKPNFDDQRTQGKLELNWNYAQAVSDAGGVPILIPPTADMAEIAKLIDGWLIPGGNDIDARNWGEENHEKAVTIEEERFTAEQRLMNEVPAGLPVFGICYGCQFINVSRGGSLVQHLPEEIGHDLHSVGTLQDYRVDEGSRLAQALGGPQVKGKSYHHQAVRRPGKGVAVVAQDEHGVVEAIEVMDRPWMLGVQWHPERTPEDPATQRLFRNFIEAAAAYARTKS
jgi:putative glutamine amidotransferase